MSARSEAKKLALSFGAEYDDDQTWHRTVPKDERYGSVEAYTPAGMMWQATSCHTLIVEGDPGEPFDWNSVLDEIRQGVTPCTIDDCEYCNPPEEEES
jgi:hypothetical protein